MHIFDLGKSALNAQSSVMQQMAIRYGRQVAFLIMAALFGFFALITGHGLVWILLVFVAHMGPVGASFTVFGLDVLAALICVLFGRRTYLTVAEVDARIARDRYLNQMRDSMTMAAVTATVASAMGRGGAGKAWSILRRKKG
ncbi:MAG: phage holin family protein [Acetobacter sp.]|uniref:phage holin family protein n=1 Tax=Acetobacter sp. TaxID=440 RepID=UPI0039EAF306